MTSHRPTLCPGDGKNPCEHAWESHYHEVAGVRRIVRDCLVVGCKCKGEDPPKSMDKYFL